MHSFNGMFAFSSEVSNIKKFCIKKFCKKNLNVDLREVSAMQTQRNADANNSLVYALFLHLYAANTMLLKSSFVTRGKKKN